MMKNGMLLEMYDGAWYHSLRRQPMDSELDQCTSSYNF